MPQKVLRCFVVDPRVTTARIDLASHGDPRAKPETAWLPSPAHDARAHAFPVRDRRRDQRTRTPAIEANAPTARDDARTTVPPTKSTGAPRTCDDRAALSIT